MKSHLRRVTILLGMALLAILTLAACAPVAAETFVTQTTITPKEASPSILPTPLPTQAGQPLSTASLSATPTPERTASAPPPPAAPPTVEAHLVELEWPSAIRMGESDVLRLALIPASQGYKAIVEFPDHTTFTQTIAIPVADGYELSLAARLDAAGFEIYPASEQVQYLPAGQALVWRWSLTPHSSGRQRLVVSLTLRWTPLADTPGERRETVVFSKALEIRVVSFLGMTRRQTLTAGALGLMLGGSLSLFSLGGALRPARRPLRLLAPNPRLVIEPRPGLALLPAERTLLQTLFRRYGRLALESEFLSGYSGARTFLALPIRPDGRADAPTIVKIGERQAICNEYENYETFVKDTLPPVTARIQHAPVAIGGRSIAAKQGLAAVQYTFIGAPGQKPISLRQALLDTPDPALLEKLFETFAPNWWMQRRPYTFRLALEYDRVLPAHGVIEPARSARRVLDGKSAAASLHLTEGELVSLRNFTVVERRADGQSLSLRGAATPGQPPLRLRWLSLSNPNGASGRVVATRGSLLRSFVAGFERFGLPDPLEKLPALLEEMLSGTRSVIHGDLNLENVLVGPGGFVWLIDFAQTREGHPLFDFAHLEAELIAHVIAPRIGEAAAYVRLLQGEQNDFYALRLAVQGIARRCLFNPAVAREYDLALFISLLGALKYNNLTPHAKHLLYLSAAHLSLML